MIVPSHSANFNFGDYVLFSNFLCGPFVTFFARSLTLSLSFSVCESTRYVLKHEAKSFEFAVHSHCLDDEFRLCLQHTAHRRPTTTATAATVTKTTTATVELRVYTCMLSSDRMFASVERTKTSTLVYWLTVSIVCIHTLRSSTTYKLQKWVCRTNISPVPRLIQREVKKYIYTFYMANLYTFWCAFGLAAVLRITGKSNSSLVARCPHQEYKNTTIKLTKLNWTEPNRTNSKISILAKNTNPNMIGMNERTNGQKTIEK